MIFPSARSALWHETQREFRIGWIFPAKLTGSGFFDPQPISVVAIKSMSGILMDAFREVGMTGMLSGDRSGVCGNNGTRVAVL